MRLASTLLPLAAGAVLALVVPALLPNADASAPSQSKEEMDEMMAKMAAVTQPGPEHEYLERMLGEWDTEARFFSGERATPAEKGRSSTTWLMEGRWIQSRIQSKLMGQDWDSVSIMGYDRFRKSYVACTTSSADTAMNHFEGDLDDKQNDDPNDDVLILWGTLDEYIDGQLGKMVKTVFRFPSADERIMEIHDMAIGENNTKVLEIRYKRRK